MCSRNSRRERPGLFNGEGGFIYMGAAELRNVDTSTRSGLSSGTGDTKHVKDKRRNEGITRELRKRKRGELRLWINIILVQSHPTCQWTRTRYPVIPLHTRCNDLIEHISFT